MFLMKCRLFSPNYFYVLGHKNVLIFYRRRQFLLLVIFNIKFERYCYLQESDAHIALLQYSGMSLVGVLHWDNVIARVT